VENICGRHNVLNHNSVPAACFTHPEVRALTGGTQAPATGRCGPAPPLPPPDLPPSHHHHQCHSLGPSITVPPRPAPPPQVSFVGVTQERAEEMAKEQGFPLGLVKTSFKANSKVGAGGGPGWV
jgi:hypothetical protein